MAEIDITKANKGLHTDNSYISQPKGTYSFALNAINETYQGDLIENSNEESNIECAKLPNGYIPIGKVYIGDENTLIFSIGENSEIGILDRDCRYETVVNGELNFKLTHQIDATFRLRRGCERTIYWVDGNNNKPLYFNIDSPDKFKTGGVFDLSKFELTRSYTKIPRFFSVKVHNSGGNLAPGSYNIGIQYLDDNLNPTEWITTSEIINVYNDSTTEDFLDIRGSINSEIDYINFPNTNKSIEIELSNLDQKFTFYRLAFIQATVGNGQVSDIFYSQKLPTSKKEFIYTGNNHETKGTQEEIAVFNNVIESAGSIEQVENRLILANTKGKKVNFCNLQQYASTIKADVVTKEVINNATVPGSLKSPTIHFESVGYMPGEIYSFGIVYIFEDATLSPVYHIPGKNQSVSSETTYTQGDNIYAMSNDNVSQTNVYTDNSSCEHKEYWGVDSEGDLLKNTPVRHHRFPLRTDINVPMLKVGDNTTSQTDVKQIILTGIGTINTPCTQEDIDNGDCAILQDAPSFQVQVTYDEDGVIKTFNHQINPAIYFEFDGTSDIEIEIRSPFLPGSIVSIVSIEESLDVGGVQDVTDGNPSPHGVSYTTTIVDTTLSSSNSIYKTDIFGIKFSGIVLPPDGEIGGEKIVGYYIVRNERIEQEKTILDSGVLVSSVVNDKFISHGLLGSEFQNEDRISKKFFGLIHPEHKFKGREYSEYTEIIQQGEFNIVDRKKSKSRYVDVLDGTSFDEEHHKKPEDDDGWALKTISRDSVVEYSPKVDEYSHNSANIKSTFYLSALESKEISGETVYNISGDNKVGFIELDTDNINPIKDKFPYVYIKKSIANSYSTFRSLPYYKTSLNVETNSSVEVFNGDSYVSPVRYVNTMFWDNRIAERATKKSFWQILAGVVLVIVGAVLTFFTAGASTIIIGAGVALIGGGALFVSSGIKKSAWNKAYNNEYKLGLRETVLDDWTHGEYNYANYTQATTPGDDEIQWIGDCVTDLWFESKINTSLRHKMVSSVPTFLDAPGNVESGREGLEATGKTKSVHWVAKVPLDPFTKLDTHLMDKLSTFDPERSSGKSYLGHCLGEWYQVNPDYERLNKEKIFFHLALEYDCCSECQEEFPHRVLYSEQSFQEELTDNFKVFLPNNYRDIEGETGEITDLFRIKNNLYIHTEENLWHLPQNYQERITDNIVSFIGSGDYFNIPPRRVVDQNRISGGCSHKWATLQTKHGVFFVSEREGKIYRFTGNELIILSDIGNSNWFRENIELKMLNDYHKASGAPYLYSNNPSNKESVGFISTYDTEKERIIFTKKDGVLAEELQNKEDFRICNHDGVYTVFENYGETIQNRINNGWSFEGIEECKLVFRKVFYDEISETRYETSTSSIPNDSAVVVQMDLSVSFGETSRDQIKSSVISWKNTFGAANPDWIGSLYFIDKPLPLSAEEQVDSERWLKGLEWALAGTNLTDQNGNTTTISSSNIILVSFVNENSTLSAFPTHYHEINYNNPAPNPTSGYAPDYNSYTTAYNNHIAGGGTFRGLIYPIVFESGIPNYEHTEGFVQHVLAALKNTYTQAEINILNLNANPHTVNWQSITAGLLGTNNYPPGLEDFGWATIYNRGWDGIGDVLTATQFQEDMNSFLTGETIITEKEIYKLIKKPRTEYENGVGIHPPKIIELDNSWTVSFSLKTNNWISWHSYLPNFYYSLANKFFSWVHGSPYFWKHGLKGKFQTFYKKHYPYIVEYVTISNPLQTKIYEDLMLHTEARKYQGDDCVDQRFTTFNKAIFYNTKQCTGELKLTIKEDNQDYMLQQVVNVTPGTILIDRNERNWTLNDVRDIRIDYDQPIFKSDIVSRKDNYFIDKVLNDSTLDFNKNWDELQNLRDKFIVVRLIFDSHEDVKLLLNYSIDTINESPR